MKFGGKFFKHCYCQVCQTVYHLISSAALLLAYVASVSVWFIVPRSLLLNRTETLATHATLSRKFTDE